MKQLSLEFYKLRRKRLWLIITLFLLVEISWAMISTTISLNRHPDQNGWEALMLMLSSMNGLFMPILVAICVSRICDMEHKGNTWKLLLTLSVHPKQLYTAKFLCACLVMVWVGVLQVLSIIAFGLIRGLEQPVPYGLLAQFLLGVGLTTMVIIALQQWISLAVKNQAFALCLGMIGGFIGLTADLFPFAIRRLFVWSYYTGLSPVQANYVNDRIHFVTQELSALLPLMAVLVLVGLVIYLAGRLHIARQEV